jgi:uncharacterized membrane protein (Fun14 family)
LERRALLASLFDVGSGAIIPALVVLAIGFLVGVVLKKTVKLGLAIASLVSLLVATGYINLQLSESSKTTIYRVFSQAPAVASQASAAANILPITSAAFLVGLALGIWKG